MALTDESNMVMPVSPMYNSGNMGFGGDWSSWIILFLIFGMFGGWGNGFGGGFGGGFDCGLYPWMNQSNQINGGFRDQMLSTQLNGIQGGVNTGFGDVQTALCGGFAGVNSAIAGLQSGITSQMYANQIADLERSFAAQTAQTQGMNALQAQLAQCCCDNRAATADLKYTVATENCQDRTQSMMNTRDIIDSQTRGTQAIIDKLCQLELDGVKGQLAQAQRDNVGLQNQLNMANLAASQTAQNTQIVDSIYNRLSTCPVGTTPVYGNQPIFTCPQTVNSCGCGVA